MTPISEWMAYFDGWFGVFCLLVGVGGNTFGMVRVTGRFQKIHIIPPTTHYTLHINQVLYGAGPIHIS